MEHELSSQINPDHYVHGYDHQPRWLAYFYQIENVLKLGKRSILEVGPGNGTVSNYLKMSGMDVTTADIDPAHGPTVVASILDLPLPDNQYDVSMACEVLEHIPFEELHVAVSELARVSKEYVIISVPDVRRTLLYLVLKLPFLPEVALRIRMMTRKIHVFNVGHFWEIGKLEYPPSRVRAVIESCGLTVIDEFAPHDAPFFHFFIMRKSKIQKT
ncbi:MAG: class I SAM-dependent methyltransferase [Patescibacteria group bacterium]